MSHSKLTFTQIAVNNLYCLIFKCNDTMCNTSDLFFYFYRFFILFQLHRPTSLYEIFTPTICEKLFHSICVVTPAPRLQLHAAALLAGMAGNQPWWGNFLSNTLINLYSSSSTHIFPQDR